jgi:hypothetical protein
LVAGIVVIALIVLGIERLNNGGSPQEAEVQMTPVVGGMTLATMPAPAGSSRREPEVTATTGSAITAGGDVSGTAQLTTGAAVSVAAAADVTATAAVTATAGVTAAANVTGTPGTGETAGAKPLIEPTRSGEPGVTVLPGANPTARPTAVRTPTAEPQVEAARPSPLFAPGEVVRPAGGRAVLHAAPGEDAPMLDSFGENASLTVLEPGDDFARYPVEVDGRSWVRVRAVDGLVGWTPAAGLSRVN